MVKISEIVEQNPWWRDGKEFARYDPNLQRAKPIFFERKKIGLKRGNIYVLRGPRQVGKTTYLKDTVRELIEERGIHPRHILYLSLDFFTSRREMRNAINYFLDSTRDAKEVYLIFDEITSLEDWNLELKFIADQGIIQRCTILATGSSPVRLKERTELLPGRGLEGNEYFIKPLCFREFVLQSSWFLANFLPQGEFKDAIEGLKRSLEECSINLSNDAKSIKEGIQKLIPFKRELSYLFQIYFTTGGLPGVINHYLSNRYPQNKEFIEQQVSEIFIRDVLGDLSKLQRQETVARQILRAIVDRYGSRYSFSKLSRDIERTHITTIDYLEFMEDSFISFILYAYDFNKKEPKLKGDKKVYFFDPFIFYSVKSFLTGKEVWEIITETRQDEEMVSKVVEGIAISHLLMYQEIPFLRTTKTFLWSYYDKSGREIDIILKENGGYSGIEVKYRAQVSEKRIKAIGPVKKYIVLSKEDVGEDERMLIVPIDIFLALLPSSGRNV